MSKERIKTIINSYSSNDINALDIQLKFVLQFLQNSKRHSHFSSEIVEIIASFLFSSPYRLKSAYILVKGECLIQQLNNSYSYISLNDSYKIKENSNFLIGNKMTYHQNIRVNKIWQKPPTKTQKKLMTYCHRFKQFVEGKHLFNIDSRYLNRQFMVSQFEQDIFDSQMKDVLQNNANFCSYEILDSFINLMTKNYIQVELGNTEFHHQRKFLVIAEGCERQISPGIKCQYKGKEWIFTGQKQVIWVQKNTMNRKKQLIRLSNGRIFHTEGNKIKDIQSIQECYHQINQV